MRGIAARLAIGLVALGTLFGGQALAGASGLREITTGDESRAWDGVGRIEMGDGGFCTGVLISDRLVLTAAHCLYDSHTREVMAPEELTFLAGWRDGRAAAHRGVRRAIPHPDFNPRDDLVGEIRHDIGLLELDHPIRNGQIQPFGFHRDEMGDSVPEGAQVGVVSYAHDRSEHPSVQEVCEVLGRDSGFLMMSCDADFGASGAPVFVFENGRPSVVSVVSAKAQYEGQKVSLGSDVGRVLGEVIDLAGATDGVFRRVGSGVQKLSSEGASGRMASGAKFLRP